MATSEQLPQPGHRGLRACAATPRSRRARPRPLLPPRCAVLGWAKLGWAGPGQAQPQGGAVLRFSVVGSPVLVVQSVARAGRSLISSEGHSAFFRRGGSVKKVGGGRRCTHDRGTCPAWQRRFQARRERATHSGCWRCGQRGAILPVNAWRDCASLGCARSRSAARQAPYKAGRPLAVPT